MKVAFVILNYNTCQETIECIESIDRKIDTKDYSIVVVDNNSSDDSCKRIEDYINGQNNITLLKNDDNVGFARGNNIGIKYANTKYNPDFVVVLNSDTELIQTDFMRKVEKEYSISKFALLGPMILTSTGQCDCSPHKPHTISQIKQEIKRLKWERISMAIGIYRLYCAMRTTLEIAKKRITKKRIPLHRNLDFEKRQINVVLQGAFLVFSNKAFKNIPGFCEDTFLYYEEPILFEDLREKGLTTVYTPEIAIFHKDGRATKNILKGKRKKLLYINKCYLQSAYVLQTKLEGKISNEY